jgi:hypothetical protein
MMVERATAHGRLCAKKERNMTPKKHMCGELTMTAVRNQTVFYRNNENGSRATFASTVFMLGTCAAVRTGDDSSF